jgi:GT2 family glycosyltransferase
LKVWLMGLPDLHDLRSCEVNILCNGNDSFEQIEQTARWFAKVLGGHIRLYLSPENVGFNVAVNSLVAASKAEYAMVTNIDVQYLRFDLDHLKTLCSRGTTICAARQFNGMGAVQHLGLQLELRGLTVHGKTFEVVESSLNGRNTYLPADAPMDVDVDFFGAACFFGKREVLQSLGPFSTRYIYAYHEDSDLSIRARSAGMKLIVTGALDLIHFESSGARVDLPKAFFIAANAARLVPLLRADREVAKVPPISTRHRTDGEAPSAARRGTAPGPSRLAHGARSAS